MLKTIKQATRCTYTLIMFNKCTNRQVKERMPASWVKIDISARDRQGEKNRRHFSFLSSLKKKNYPLRFPT
ncbi:unnamed protein product [Ixodes pacificus]